MNRAIVPVLVGAGVLAGIGAALVGTRKPASPSAAPPALEHATAFAEPRPLPAFDLQDGSGASFGPDGLRGRWTFLFFGFTNCPDICPTTLATLAEAAGALGDLSPAERPAVLFVSVDPARDTPEAVGRYAAHFDPAFRAATGNRSSIDALAAALGVAVIIGPAAPDGSYAVDHSAAVFLVDPAARIVALFGAPHEAAAIARDYRRIVDAG